MYQAELDKPSKEKVCTFNSLEEMIKCVLRFSVLLY